MNRKNAILCSLAAALLLPAALSAAKAPVIQPGRWEVTIKTEFKGRAPATTTEICISPERAANLEPPKTKANHDCQVTGGFNGNLLKYTIKCGRKHAKTDAEFTYSGDRYEGVVTIKNDDYEIRQVYTARRLGECEIPNEE